MFQFLGVVAFSRIYEEGIVVQDCLPVFPLLEQGKVVFPDNEGESVLVVGLLESLQCLYGVGGLRQCKFEVGNANVRVSFQGGFSPLQAFVLVDKRMLVFQRVVG